MNGLLIALLSASTLGTPGLTGDQLLQQLDAGLEKTKDQILTMEMLVQDPGHDPRRIGLQMHMRGEQRRINFLYPGDMKGMRVLNISAEQTYVYLPAFKKVRRVAGHAKDQSMFGSDYGFDDFSTIALHQNYSAEITHEDDNFWTVRAVPRTGVDTEYARIEMQVDKKRTLLSELRYFDASGSNIRTEERSDYQCENEVCVPRKTKMVDHRHDDHWTEVTIKNLKLNSNFSDQVFSLRDLQRND